MAKKTSHKKRHRQRKWWRGKEKRDYRLWQRARKWSLSRKNRKERSDEYERAKRHRRWLDSVINSYHEAHKTKASPIHTRYVRNYSSRRGVKPSLIVIHSTESDNIGGWDDAYAVANWFNNPASQASSHLIIDAEGHVLRVVRDRDKAWTQAAYNSRSLSIELIGRATQPADEWTNAQIDAAAQEVRKWSKKYNILIDSDHVVTHKSLGQAGGGHSDPGTFPMKTLRSRARG